MEIQKNIRLSGPEDFHNIELIRQEELQAIRRIWVLEKHEFDDSLPLIYEEVLEEPFEDPDWIHEENFGREEWNILKSVCDENYKDEELAFEMMYRMIDIENHATGLNQRKGIIDSIESVIAQTFYKNENDAQNYYFEKMTRKKEMGGRYNEKFLDYIPAGADENDEDTEGETE